MPPAVALALHHLCQVVLRTVAVDPVLRPFRNINIGLGALGRQVTGWEAVSLTDLVNTISIKGEKYTNKEGYLNLSNVVDAFQVGNQRSLGGKSFVATFLYTLKLVGQISVAVQLFRILPMISALGTTKTSVM